jgi:hypothetical protein
MLMSENLLTINIGQIPITFHFSETALFKHAVRRYSAFFAKDGESGLPIIVGPEPLGTAFRSEFAVELNDAQLALGARSAHFCGVRNEFALDSLVRIVLTELLLKESGFLLHAATIMHNDKAYVFTGQSGAGKSTVAALSSPGRRVLTDEISLLRISECAWQAHGTPFWGEFHAGGSNLHFPVAGIYLLTQAAENRAERLTPKEALRALFLNVLFFDRSKPAAHNLLSLLVDAVGIIPCYRLRFRRDASFWKEITC